MGKQSSCYNPEGQRARGPEGQRARGPEGQAGGVMSWVLSLARSGGTTGSQDGHETRRHRVRGPFPMGASLLLAGTLALAGCGSSSSSIVAINEQQPQLEPEPKPEPQTGDGDGDTGSGDTTTTDDGGATITQQQQPPQEPLEPEPEPEPEPQPVTQQPSNQPQPQAGGGTGGGGTGGGGTGGGGQGGGGGNLGSSRSPAGTSGGITRSGFDSIEAHSHIKDKLFPLQFWQLSTAHGLNFYYKIRDQNDRTDVHDYSGRIRIGVGIFGAENQLYLTEDTNTKVPDSYGWQGKRLTRGNTEAYVFTKKAGGFTSTGEDHTRHYNYGWWLNKDNWSSFANYYNHGYNEDNLNEPVNPIGRTGTATYVGGAGGYYAFVHGGKVEVDGYTFDSREPGISGEFRAKARLEVNFTNNTMSGKIFNFTNPDGTPIRNNDEVKDWTVELLNGSYDTNEQTLIGNKTKWYDGEHLIEGDGRWEGHYYEDTSIFMGQFLASHGAIGKMVGSFGTNRQ